MMVHLSIEGLFGQSFLEFIEQPIVGESRSGIYTTQQMIWVPGFLAACHATSPSRSS
jgi:hypothetical protein